MLLPEIVFASTDSVVSRRLSRLREAGRLRKLVPRTYTSNFTDDDTVLVKRHWIKLLDHLYPNSMLSYKSALLFAPDADGNLFLQGQKRRPVKWPGMTLYFVTGAPKLGDDQALATTLSAPSLPRALLENLSPDARAVGGVSRTLAADDLERKLLEIVDSRGESGLQAVRDRAREIAARLGWEAAFAKLNTLVAALLNTGPSSALTTPAAQGRRLGTPVDGPRVDRFLHLHRVLLATPWPDYPATFTSEEYRVFAFYESYFSNFIEGTEFTIEEAERIVFGGEDLPMQTEDSHDVRRLYELCSDREQMRVDTSSYEAFAEQLRRQHAYALAQRPQKNPGRFKAKANRAGDTEFVRPEYVQGTLRQGFDFLAGLHHPFARAAFLMFVISEVHPFDDGNGRLARLFMNAALSEAGQAKIIIPTVYRDDYLLALRALSRRDDPEAYVRMLRRIWGYSAAIPLASLAQAREFLADTNAFRLSAEAVVKFPEGV